MPQWLRCVLDALPELFEQELPGPAIQDLDRPLRAEEPSGEGPGCAWWRPPTFTASGCATATCGASKSFGEEYFGAP